MPNAKQLVYSIVSKNDAMMKELRAALKTPVGSAKRKMASKKMKLFMNAAKNRLGYQDGTGGYGPAMPSSNPLPSGTAVNKENGPKNFVVLHQPRKKITASQPSLMQEQVPQLNQPTNPGYENRSELFRNFAKKMFLVGKNDGIGGGGNDGKGGNLDYSSMSGGVYFDPQTGLLKGDIKNPVTSTPTSDLLSFRGSYVDPSPQTSSFTSNNSLSSLGSGLLPKSDSLSPNSTFVGTTVKMPTSFDSKSTKTTYTPDMFTKLTTLGTDPNREKVYVGTIPSFVNMQETLSFNKDIEEAKAKLRNGASWGPIWDEIKAKYPTKNNVEIDRLLEKDRYYVNGVWINPRTGMPVDKIPQTGSPSTVGTGTEKPAEAAPQVEAQEKTEGTPAGMGDTLPLGATVGSSYETSISGEGTTPGTNLLDNIYAQNLINSYTGRPEALKSALFSDRERMAKFLGVNVNEIPDYLSPLISQMNADEEERLRDEYGIDGMRRKLFNRIYSGVNIQKDLENYVTNKDQYISKIDEQKRRALTWRDGQDMSNPVIAQSVNNYFTYLDSLKTSQQKRYLDLVNDAINQYDTTNKQLELIYTEAYNDFNRELTTTTNVNNEWYTKMNNIILEMYNWVTGSEKRSVDAQELELKRLKLGNDMIKALGGDEESPEDVGSDAIRHQASYEKILEGGSKRPVTSEVDSNGEVKSTLNVPTFDILQALLTAQNEQGDQSTFLQPGAFIYHYKNTIGDTMQKLIDVNEVSAAKKDSLGYAANIFTNNILNFYKQAVDKVWSEEQRNELVGYAQDLVETFSSNINQDLVFDLENDPASQQLLITAFKELVAPYNTWKPFDKRLANKTDVEERLPAWIEKYKEKINPSILKAIENYIGETLPAIENAPILMFTEPMGIMDVNTPAEALDKLTPAQIAYIITKGYLAPFKPITLQLQ